MPKLFGLRLHDIVATPGKLRLDVDAAFCPSSGGSPASKRKRSATAIPKRSLFSRRNSKYSKNSSRSEATYEHRGSVGRRIQDLSALIMSMGLPNSEGENSPWTPLPEQNPSTDRISNTRESRERYEGIGLGYRRRPALINVHFSAPASSTTGYDRV